MITITRSMARLVRAVFRKALGITARGRLFTVLIETSGAGLVFRARSFNMAAEYRLPGDHPAESLAVPFELLEDCEGRTDEPVRLSRCGKGTVEAQWADGSIPQVKQYLAGKPDDVLKGFPSTPGTLAENKPGLLTALRDAADTSDANAARYATNKVQLRGATGSIGATDGRHLLLQQGFAFPWEEELLIPTNKVFAGKELSAAQTVYIGRTENWVSLAAEGWKLHFEIDKDGRFPRIDDHIRPGAAAQTRLQLSETDAVFLQQTLDRLPCDEDSHFAITIELNSQAIIRAKTRDQPRSTELVLSGSQAIGTPVTFSINRQYLARAVRLGFREVLVFENNTPVQCRDQHRQYVWAVLDPEGVIKSGKDAIRIESQEAGTPSPQPNQQRKQPTMPRRKRNEYGVVPANGTSTEAVNGSTDAKANGAASSVSPVTPSSSSTEHVAEVSLIEQAEAVRSSLRDTGDKVAELISSLKRHRKQSRLVQSTLSSLKQLQTLDA